MIDQLLKKNLTLEVKVPTETIDFFGKWENELGSTMTIKHNQDGTITGKYVTVVGKPGKKEEFNLTGFTSGDLIAFCVNFGKYGSLTSWSGQYGKRKANDHKEVLHTMWHLALDIEDADEHKNLWGAVWTGFNNFERVK